MHTSSVSLPLISLLFGLSSGIMLAAAMTLGLLSRISSRPRMQQLYFSLTLICFCGAGYQISTLFLHQAASLNESLAATRWQLSFALLSPIGYAAFCSLSTQHEQIRTWVTIVIGICITLLFINLTAPYTLRFDTITGVRSFDYPWGENLFLLRGTPGQLKILWVLFINSVYAYCLWRFLRHWWQEHSLISALWACYLLLQAASSLIGSMIDRGELNSVYVYGFSTTILVISICASLAYAAVRNAAAARSRETSLKQEMAQRKDAEDRVKRIAFEDHLTELPTRLMLKEYLNQRLPIDSKTCPPFLYLQINLDHFKHINDELGQDVGDQLLKLLAKRLVNTVGQSMMIARIAGDEFVILDEHINSQTPEYAKRIAGKVLDVIHQPLQINDHSLQVGATIGIVLVPEHASSVHDVMSGASVALNRGKKSGRGGFHFYHPVSIEENRVRQQLEQELRQALHRNQFELHVQPLLDKDRRCIGAEALLRWNHPRRGLTTPGSFIALSEETGLINSIGDWVFKAALEILTQWQKDIPWFLGYLTVNVSPWQFARPDFVDNLFDAITSSGINPSRLCLEVTEGVLLTDFNETLEKLHQLRNFGLKIALDDFGTGYSSLAYLRDLPIDILKIDRSFISELHSESPRHLVNAIISIGQHMEIITVAEGVETEFQWAHLHDMGCDMFQGFLFAKPMSRQDFGHWLGQDCKLEANNPK
ncbi:bifunctional diguanylate cyclase/phosphodiesterase [Aestuariirhabdus sp. Z084]|uniref:putative bifunctional diguanylate cyclase/phosphodiesterase n=1 Tax=Aestuariirhabdus haliotis TaxID=2918751 RepID=UPI00201B44EE|nr:bifunctional diguanylate cyclase/phosphodiesterase [Aestuariirhabdus haliotis]MCL6416223.1 bifunctional diguanylate cyclase/phosphodiesterase [Aestuariirhabdus haliotis]MCL6420317.1 bifunctional diguanylate cyclase/phosphodiesterase [Aestuariirhabdus haliotis]